MGLEPVDNWVLELAQSVYDGDIAVVADVLDVFYGGGEVGVRREGEKQGLDGGVKGEKWFEKREVFGGDEDCDGDVSEAELVGEV